MKVANIHQREIDTSKEEFVTLFSTLATSEDKIWPYELWPRMKMNNGLNVGSIGRHGPIHYEIIESNLESHLVFQFQRPIGFHGVHKFEFAEKDANKILLKHTIDIATSGLGTFKWILGIRSLHNALIEDAFDKIENHLTGSKKKSEWNLYVRFLRTILS